jgi:hypothetical protein
MKKALDTDQIANELKGRSLYFEDQSKWLSKQTDHDEQQDTRTTAYANGRTHEQANARTDERVNARTDEQAHARTDEQANTRTRERTNQRADEQVNIRTNERMNKLLQEDGENQIGEPQDRESTRMNTSVGKNAGRIIRRHSYQFYVDQVKELKSLWLSYQARGIDIDLSDLAREAFDEYLGRVRDKANAQANERANARTGDHSSK